MTSASACGAFRGDGFGDATVTKIAPGPAASSSQRNPAARINNAAQPTHCSKVEIHPESHSEWLFIPIVHLATACLVRPIPVTLVCVFGSTF